MQRSASSKGSRKSMREIVWKLTLAYDGTMFHGWQIQPGAATIQGTLGDAIAAVTGERVLPQGAGRTDAGVHAVGQVASFPLAAPIPAENFQSALNRVLPSAIRILTAEPALPDFHARHSSVGKIYRYRVFRGRTCSPFLAPYVASSRWQLDLQAMQQAAQHILGEHDFTSFAASDPDRTARLAGETHSEAAVDADAPSNIRRVDYSQWECASLHSTLPGTLDELNITSETSFKNRVGEFSEDRSVLDDRESAPRIFTYTIRGNGFLHHMVRNLVGTFLEIGRGRIAASDIPQILAGRNRALAGPTAAAGGLCLMKVLY